jgi:hypothetical protein
MTEHLAPAALPADPLAPHRVGEAQVERKMKRWLPKRDEACANCGTVLLGPYCHACGQPTKHFIRHIPSVLKDLLDGLFSIDSRILRTLAVLLFRPGRLTMEYVAGRRARYTPPLQLYLIISVAMFLVLSWVTVANQDNIQLNASGNSFNIGPTPSKDEPIDLPAADKEPDAKRSVSLMDGAVRLEGPDQPAEDDNEGGDFTLSFNDKPWHPTDNPLVVPYLPDFTNAWLNRHIERQKEKVGAAIERKDARGLVTQGIKLLPYAMFLLMPFYALILALLYVFKRRYYAEHLVFAVHMHSFSFVLQMLLIGIAEFVSLANPSNMAAVSTLIGIITFWQFFGTLWAQKRVYAQGWFFTSIKYFCLMVSYAMCVGFTLVGLMLVAVLTF